MHGAPRTTPKLLPGVERATGRFACEFPANAENAPIPCFRRMEQGIAAPLRVRLSRHRSGGFLPLRVRPGPFDAQSEDCHLVRGMNPVINRASWIRRVHRTHVRLCFGLVSSVGGSQ